MKIVFLTTLNGYKENIMKINGDQLKRAIDLLSSNYTKEEMIKFYNSQLTTKQLGEVVRQMLNDVKYSKELNEEDSLATGAPVFDTPSAAFWESWGSVIPRMEDAFKQQIKDMIDEGKSLEQIKTFINDNTGVHTN